MENIKIFEKHFRKGMIVKDFEAFKRTHPTLLKCILEAMNEVLPQVDVMKSWRFCPICGTEWTKDCEQFGCLKCGEI